MPSPTQFLVRNADPARGFPAHKLAYLASLGKGPKLVWLGGFRSDMTSTKAAALDDAAREAGLGMVRFDYYAHGESEGDFSIATLSLWLDDALAIIRETAGPAPILIGSSMGGWIALLATLILRAEGRAPGGLVLIAPAVDFTQGLMWAQFPEAIRKQIMEEGVWYRHSEYSPEPYPITRALIEDARNHLIMGQPHHYGVPMHILQGAQDPDVPLAYVEKFIAGLPEEDIRITVIPDGNHRLSREEDIAALCRIAVGLAREVGDGKA